MAPPRKRPAGPESTEDYAAPPPLAVEDDGVRLRVGVATTKGNVREHNEDNFYVPGRSPVRNGRDSDHSTEEFLPPVGPRNLVIVADGMGGQQAGETASGMAVEWVPRELMRRLNADLDDKGAQRAVREAIARANEEILAQSHLQPECANMGTTVVLALFRRGKAYVAGIGDSRAYRLREGRIEQLTRDHSLANALGEAGTIKPEEVETHRFKHVLYLYLGSREAADGPEEVRLVETRPGDKFLLASDGLTGVVRDDVLAEILMACDDPQRAAQALVNRALENRSKDNITSVVVEVL